MYTLRSAFVHSSLSAHARDVCLPGAMTRLTPVKTNEEVRRWENGCVWNKQNILPTNPHAVRVPHLSSAANNLSKSLVGYSTQPVWHSHLFNFAPLHACLIDSGVPEFWQYRSVRFAAFSPFDLLTRYKTKQKCFNTVPKVVISRPGL